MKILWAALAAANLGVSVACAIDGYALGAAINAASFAFIFLTGFWVKS